VNIVHEHHANNSPNFSPNDLFCLPGEQCSWTVREQFAELFAKWPILPPRRTLLMNNSRTIRQNVRQMTSLEIMANIVHEHQLHHCSRTARRTIRHTDNTAVIPWWENTKNGTFFLHYFVEAYNAPK
jgi:hypothetical protein